MPDVRMQRVLHQHEARHAAGLPVYEGVRDKKVAQYQALLEGQGGKYTHADHVDNGSTQVAGTTTHTPSMTAVDNPKLLGQVKGLLSTKTYYNTDNAFNFRP